MIVAISDRTRVGLLIGWSYFPQDDNEDWTELNIYLLLICLHLKWKDEKEV